MATKSTPDQLLHSLLQVNLAWLDQAVQLVASLNDEQYSTSPAGLCPHKAGAHLRHLLDFYDSLIAGLASGHVDYDARMRDERTALDRRFAIERIRAISLQLQSACDGSLDQTLLVRMEDADAELSFPAWMRSSLARELQTLSSHTIHHFALIGVTLRAHGVQLDPGFGTAPSTLSYQARRAAA